MGDYNNAFREFRKFNLKEDTLRVDVKDTPQKLLFKIQKINQDSLVLLPLDIFTKREINADTSIKSIALRKLKNQWTDNEEIMKVSCSTMPCFGKCPRFDLEINNNMKGFFNAIRYTKLEEGNYETRLDSQEISFIFGKVKQVRKEIFLENNIKSIDTQILHLIITLKNGQKIKSEAVWTDVDFKELSILLKYLFNLERKLKWKKTDEVHFFETELLLPPPIKNSFR